MHHEQFLVSVPHYHYDILQAIMDDYLKGKNDVHVNNYSVYSILLGLPLHEVSSNQVILLSNFVSCF